MQRLFKPAWNYCILFCQTSKVSVRSRRLSSPPKLQFFSKREQQFFNVPCSGHAVATVFVGSVLQHVTGGYFAACRHRVVYDTESNDERMAATLFVRPSPTARLTLPPSPILKECKVKGNLTFAQWNARVSRNYEKARRRRVESSDNKR